MSIIRFMKITQYYFDAFLFIMENSIGPSTFSNETKNFIYFLRGFKFQEYHQLNHYKCEYNTSFYYLFINFILVLYFNFGVAIIKINMFNHKFWPRKSYLVIIIFIRNLNFN